MRNAAMLLALAAVVTAAPGRGLPPSGRQLWPWPIGGRLTRAYVDKDGFAWVGNNGGDVLRIDPKRVPEPAAYRMFHLADGFEIRALDGKDGRVFAVGHLAGAGGAIYEFDGARWRGVYVTAAGYANRFHSIGIFGKDDIWVLGTSMTTGSACVRFDGRRWRRVESAGAQYLSGLARLPDGSIWSGGVKQMLHRWNGERWEVGRRIPMKYLWALFPCGNRVYLQGTDAKNIHCVLDITEEKPRRIRLPRHDADISIAGVVGDTLYCTDSKRRLWKVTPQRATFVAEDAQANVAGLPDGRLLLTGSNGLLEIMDGSQRIPCGYRGVFTQLAYSRDSRQCVASTKKGPFVVFDGKTIRLIPRPDRSEVAQLAIRTPDEIYAAYRTGHVYRFDGRLWTRVTPVPLTETYQGTNHGRTKDPVRFEMLYLPAKRGLVVFPSLDCWDGAKWERLKLPFDPYKPKRFVETGAVITHLPEYPGIGSIGGDSIATLFIQTSEGFFLRDDGRWLKLDPRLSLHRRLYAPGEKHHGELRLTMVGLRTR